MLNYSGVSASLTVTLSVSRDGFLKDEDQLLGLISAVEAKIKENDEILAKLQKETSKQ